MASFLVLLFAVVVANVRADSPRLRRLQECSFASEPANSYFWDPVGCGGGGLGCNADGRHTACRWCGHGPYVPCPNTPGAACTPMNGDPWATGNKLACCSALQECLGDHAGSGRWFYKCLASCSSRPQTTLAPTPAPWSGGGRATLSVMSYNTQYSGYPDRVSQYGRKISSVGAGVVGTQECQDKDALGSASGYQVVPGTDFQNPIFYDPSKVSLVDGSGGWMAIPRDDYSPRTITWATFRLGSIEFWFFNTHLPHNHREARSSNTHARIARTLLQKRAELGAGDAPTVITGDCNPFASNGASEGSFESNLIAAGFKKSYQARGNPGFGGLDKIFSSSHWSSSNGADRGTGSSDHPAIVVDLRLNR